MPDIDKLYTVPLTQEEHHHLLTVYNTRLRLFAFVFGVFILMGIYYSLPAYKSDGGNSYDNELFGYKVVEENLFLLVLFLMQGTIFILGTRLFLRKIYCFKKDADCGRKERIFYTVTDKKHFPNTNQYYISFDDPNYMHHEIEADIYWSLQVGDTVPVYRGVYSKHVFEKDGRFTFM